MYSYRLSKVEVNNGVQIPLGNLTVIIGPNNAGKSRALKDIASITTQRSGAPTVVVQKVEWSNPPSFQELRSTYRLERYQDGHNNWMFRALAPELTQERQFSADYWSTEQQSTPYLQQESLFAQHLGFALVAFITTEHRLQLVKDATSCAHDGEEANLLQALYNAGTHTESVIAQLVQRTFGKQIKLDNTVSQRLCLRVGNDFSSIPPDPRDARIPMRQYEKLDDQGDGIRSFVGIATALLATNRSVFLIDEPEAFLHPPQAFRIGAFLAEQASDQRQIILATHSADVLRGILSRTDNVTILRIDRRDQVNSFSILDSERLRELISDPLLSSARVLDGLFYAGVVVVEADSDARFYQMASSSRKNDIDLHFVNADNKQTVPRIIKLYRNMGVRCAGIVDFDVLRDPAEFTSQLEALNIEPATMNSLRGIRDTIDKAAKEFPLEERIENVRQQIRNISDLAGRLAADGEMTTQDTAIQQERQLNQIGHRAREIQAAAKEWSVLKEKGVAALPPALKDSFEQLWQVCAQSGLFINPCGELESMLVQQGIHYTTDKRAWIARALSLLPRLVVNDGEYPWRFIKSIQEYLLHSETR